MRRVLKQRLVTNLAFWAGAVAGSLTTMTGIIADAVGFSIPFALLFPAAAIVIFGRPLWKMQKAFHERDNIRLSNTKIEVTPQEMQSAMQKQWGRPENND